MIIGVVKETFPGERRVALVPASLPALTKAGHEVLVQAGAGQAAGFADREYQAKGAKIIDERREVFRAADVLCQVRTASANPREGLADLALHRQDQTIVGLAEPLSDPSPIQALAATGAQVFAMELIPRITRAQSMDVLSSQATVAGYKAVLLAAQLLPRMFPMMMTAAGTITPAKVFVIGAGVAGLQAIASARRMGAVAQAYDIRPAVKEQVESIGARFLQIELESTNAEDKGGYARAMDETFYRKQRELMAKAVAQSDVVITTAAVPGGRPPMLITADMVGAMSAGSIIIDLAAKPGSHGGNCELTVPDQTVTTENDVTILGPTNLPATVPQTASQLYAKNITTFVLHLVRDGKLAIDPSDEITNQTLLTQRGEIVNGRVREVFKFPPLPQLANVT